MEAPGLRFGTDADASGTVHPEKVGQVREAPLAGAPARDLIPKRRHAQQTSGSTGAPASLAGRRQHGRARSTEMPRSWS